MPRIKQKEPGIEKSKTETEVFVTSDGKITVDIESKQEGIVDDQN